MHQIARDIYEEHVILISSHSSDTTTNIAVVSALFILLFKPRSEVTIYLMYVTFHACR